MREIKFKAKRKDNGEWVEGDLLHEYWLQGDYFMKTAIRYKVKNKDEEYYSFPIEVNRSAVCEFVKQVNGEDVFCGDIVKDKSGVEYVVYWNEQESAYYGRPIEGELECWLEGKLINTGRNIFDKQ